MASDDYQLGTFRLLTQPPGRLIAEQQSLDAHIWILLLPAGETFGENFLRLTLVVLPVHSEHRKHPYIAPCVQRHQTNPSAGGFIKGQGGRRFRGWRSVDAQ